MENFFKLRADKQKHIIDAAIGVFGRNGYKKASISEIAEEAGIAKGMVNYYFGCKKNLYLYLVEMSGKLIVEEIESRMDKGVTDYFDKIKMATEIKISAVKKHSGILMFFTKAYYETDEDVVDDLREYFREGYEFRNSFVHEGTDVSRFKVDVDLKLLDQLFIWMAEGIAQDIQSRGNAERLDELAETFYQCLELFKKFMYVDE